MQIYTIVKVGLQSIMRVSNRLVSEKLRRVLQDAEKIATTQGKIISFRSPSEHSNPVFRNLRGIRATVPEHPNEIGIYLNDTLKNEEFELVAVHELCHEIAGGHGFLYKYGLTSRVQKQQLDIWENLAASLGECFTHLTVYKLTKDYGYDISEFDNTLLNEIRVNMKKSKRIGTVTIAHHVIMHISNSFQERYLLSTLNFSELEKLLNAWDWRILTISRNVEIAIPDINLLSVTECFHATLALRNALGKELSVPLEECIHFRNPQTGSLE